MEKIRKGDIVVVLTGKDKGKTGVAKVMPIHISNVALFNAKTQKADRVGIKEVDGKKVRVFKSNGEAVA